MTHLRHGVFMAPFHATRENPTAAMHRDFELVEWLDRLGFDEAWFGEHHSGGYETIASPELFIAAAAERTSRIRLGTGVITLPYHNPLMVANRIVQLDHQTRGRIMFGVGPGLLVTDQRMLGIDPQKSRERMEEALGVIIRLLQGEIVTHKSDWFELKDAQLHLLPYQRPYPEIAVPSAVSPSGARAAGKFGASMLCVAAGDQAGYDSLRTNWEIANDVAAKNGRTIDPKTVRLVTSMHIAETREQARKNVEFGLRDYVYYRNSVTPGAFREDGDLVEHINNPKGDSSAFFAGSSSVIGTPDDAIALIDRLIERQGVFGTVLQLGHNWADFEATKKSWDLYMRYVVPHFNKANANRQASLDRMRAGAEENERQRSQAVNALIEKHKAETKS
ncbi:MAG: LLM class flavin-dependent oxidoreductase [Shinella sp.]|nr:MAG: LLM class flavin-dependent oxidoreductase [Shinella sp.]